MPEHGLLWAVIGLVLGTGAKFLNGGFDVTGCLATVVMGMVGAVFGGWTAHETLGWSDADGHFAILAAIVGAWFVLWFVSTIMPRRY